MAFPDDRYIYAPPIQTYFVDKDTGFPLAGGTVTFYRDVARTTLKPIYQQVQALNNEYEFVELPNPITLTSVGTYDDGNGTDINVYLYPFTGKPTDPTQGVLDLYYIEVESSTGVAQETREAWPPNALNETEDTSINNGVNVILNPQFVDVSFIPNPATGAYAFNVSTANQVTSIAPGWDIVTSGTGIVTIAQIAITDTAAPSNPPYALNIQVGTGVTSCQLRQRVYNSPRFLKDEIVSGTFIIKANTSALPFITLNYQPSNSTTAPLITICSGSPTGSTFVTIANTVGVPISITNPDAATTGYVDFYLDIPTLADIQISSVQVVSVASSEIMMPFLELSTPIQVNGEYFYDRDNLIYKQVPSYLVGWDFPLNPAQENGPTVAASAIGANKSKYVWDQTIVFQGANSGVGVTAAAAGQLVLTAAATTQIGLIQYLPQTIARKVLNAPICANISAKASINTKVTVSLWYTVDVSLPVATAGTNNSLVLTLDANGKPATFNGTWSEVPNLTHQNSFIIEPNTTTNFNDYPITGWDMQGIAACDTATFFAIVIGTESVAITNTLTFNSVSLQAGGIPTRPAPQTIDEVLRECQYYYETSFAPGSVATATQLNSILAPMDPIISGGTNFCEPNGFGVNYVVRKPAVPNLVLYSGTSTTAGKVQAYVSNGGAPATAEADLATYFTQQNAGVGSANYYGSSGSMAAIIAGASISAHILYQYVADARLGIV
jgi:hypothetical protein